MEYKNKGDIIPFVRQKDYVWEKFLDEGGLGKTALLRDPIIDEYFVCKKYEPQSNADKLVYFENFKNEIKIMHKLFHKNIVRIYNYYLFPNQVTGFILMDFINGYDIENYLKSAPEDINNIFAQTIDAFSYLEKHGILHRDIRPKNILVKKDKTVKLIDFGFGKQVNTSIDFDNSISINWLYDKPDDFNNSIYDFKTEIYFIGKLFEDIIKNYSITGFSHTNILNKMILKSPDKRIDTFKKINEEILHDYNNFDDYFDNSEKKLLQQFLDQVVSIFSDLDHDSNYFNNIDNLLTELEEVLKNNSFEFEIINSIDIARAFVKGNYRYYSSNKVITEYLKSFIQLIRKSNVEKKNLINLGIINRLRTIERKEKKDDGFIDDIPF